MSRSSADPIPVAAVRMATFAVRFAASLARTSVIVPEELLS